MKLLFLADWHNQMYDLPNEDIDVLLVLGDFKWQTVEWLDRTYTCTKIGLLGNHDKMDTYRNTSFTHLHNQTIQIGGYVFAGFDGCPRYNTRKGPQYEEKDVHNFTKELQNVDFFLAHANPKFEENNDITDAHRGFEAFTSYIHKENPLYFVHGHNHENKHTKIGFTDVVCVYPTYLLTI